MDGSKFANSSSVTDLGMLVNSRLTFNLHVNNILTKTTQRAGILSVDFHHASLLLLEKLS